MDLLVPLTKKQIKQNMFKREKEEIIQRANEDTLGIKRAKSVGDEDKHQC